MLRSHSVYHNWIGGKTIKLKLYTRLVVGTAA